MFLATLAMLAAVSAPAAIPTHTQYPPQVADQMIKKIYTDRDQAEAWMRQDPESYLAAMQRKDFAGRTSLTIGRAEDNDIRIDNDLIRPHHLRVTVVGDSFHVQALDDSARFRVENEYETRDSTLGPSTIGIGKVGYIWGRFHLRLSHQNYPALILFDGFSDRFKQYHGLKHFPADLGYRYVLPLVPNPHPDTILIASTRGGKRPAVRLGWFDFKVGAKPCRLTALHVIEPGIPAGSMVVFFRDATSGKETCALGRYLEATKLGASGHYLLDFNTATNPACAFSDLYNCPIPPKENTLKAAILAGEKDMHYATAWK